MKLQQQPFAIAVHPAAGEEPAATLWDPKVARKLADFVANKIVSTEDVLLLVTRDLPSADLVHVLRELADLVARRELREPGWCADLRPRIRRRDILSAMRSA